MSERDDSVPRAPWRRMATVLLLWISGWLVFRGSLAFFFAQDDFGGLARGRGLLPPLAGLWRYLSGQAYFRIMWPLAGLDPLPYRTVSLAAHLAAATLLFAWLRRRVSRPAAWTGATFFVVHPALFTALYSVSGIGEILALGFGLAALLLAARADRARWLAPVCFAASLLSKESMLLLPVVAALPLARPAAGVAPPARRRDPLLATLALMAVAYTLYFAFFVHGTQFMGPGTERNPGAAPYATTFDATLLWNLLTYLGWTVNFLLFTVRGVSDIIQRSISPAALIAAGLWAAGLLWKPLRARGWIEGGVIYLCFLLPVLPLANHSYHYYLYAPLAGAALCVAALVDAVTARRAPARRAKKSGRAPRAPEGSARLTLAAVLAVALTANGALLVHKIETYPFTTPSLRADPTVDRALIAARVHESLNRAALPEGVRLLFWSPPAIALERAAGRDTTVESYWERNVREALLDGLAVRTMFPSVGEVAFVRAFRPTGPDTRWAIYDVDGRLIVATAARVDSLMRRASR